MDNQLVVPCGINTDGSVNQIFSWFMGYLRYIKFGLIVWLFTVQVAVARQQEIRMSIYFGGGDYSVDTLQAETLHHWLDSIPNLERYEVQLISHTDPIGGRQYNEWLSRMRSETVKQLVLQKEIPEHKISIKDWGLDNAVYTNRTRQGMRLNRRVDVILYPVVF